MGNTVGRSRVLAKEAWNHARKARSAMVTAFPSPGAYGAGAFHSPVAYPKKCIREHTSTCTNTNAHAIDKKG